MSQSVGALATAQSFEVLGAVMAKKQQNQQAQMANILLQSAMQTVEQTSAASPVGNIGQNINISV
ncbi:MULTISPECIES: hypothetical protein [unclassified Arsukibacterium]|uniref:hypothetical protein n=1 Tax=unclassified Arsukibacterium TaxID=2635278 RepID=UPI000C53819C|nr:MULTISPECIES: hypothetical protein [unclassified Arsukibacterium]MAA95739.1 hypothetical protein [Rheinheimera sp.]MBM34557.1 hypothetical protein [Rheinheimera sp.]HAW91574.1 hypothetical protein [Candidatus Azambacteria bacterium]|tara:strand:+ start:1869 stop:2063 length:195 start_codon:yes stop_codon:yes gene_type:complete